MDLSHSLARRFAGFVVDDCDPKRNATQLELGDAGARLGKRGISGIAPGLIAIKLFTDSDQAVHCHANAALAPGPRFQFRSW